MIHIPKSIYATTNNALYFLISTGESLPFHHLLMTSAQPTEQFHCLQPQHLNDSFSPGTNLNSIIVSKKFYLTPILGPIYHYLHYTLLNEDMVSSYQLAQL